MPLFFVVSGFSLAYGYIKTCTACPCAEMTTWPMG